jgi:hypothetical protein
MLLAKCADHCQENDDGEKGCQHRGSIRVEVPIFFVVSDGVRSDVVSVASVGNV